MQKLERNSTETNCTEIWTGNPQFVQKVSYILLTHYFNNPNNNPAFGKCCNKIFYAAIDGKALCEWQSNTIHRNTP